jgi:hypothetical protein
MVKSQDKRKSSVRLGHNRLRTLMKRSSLWYLLGYLSFLLSIYHPAHYLYSWELDDRVKTQQRRLKAFFVLVFILVLCLSTSQAIPLAICSLTLVLSFYRPLIKETGPIEGQDRHNELVF